MSCIHLRDFSIARGQANAASLLGMTQSSLNKALKVGRDVYVAQRPDGTFVAQELRQFPFRGGIQNELADALPTLNQIMLQKTVSEQSATGAGDPTSISQVSS